MQTRSGKNMNIMKLLSSKSRKSKLLSPAFIPVVLSAFLASCVSTTPNFGGLGSLNNNSGQTAGQTGLQPGNLPQAQGEILGSGPVRVALLVPKSRTGFAGIAAENFRNAADLALREFGQDVVQIVVKDTQGTPEGAAAAAQQAISEGAELILGPLFSTSVTAVAGVARPAGVPIVSFTTTSSVGQRGVYTFGIAPEAGVKRVASYAGSRGSRTFAALIPNNALGTITEGALRQSVSAFGGQLVTAERYTDGTDAATKAATIASLITSGQVDTVFIPGSGDVAPSLVQAIQNSGIQPGQVRFIGSGQWDDPRIFRDARLAGSFYPAPNRDNYLKFASRYNTTYGKPPVRLASLAYDAASLTIVLTRQFGDSRFSEQRLTSASGYKGVVDGIFRLNINGSVDHSLAVYEVTESGPRIADPAPAGFARTASR